MVPLQNHVHPRDVSESISQLYAATSCLNAFVDGVDQGTGIYQHVSK